MQFQPISAGLFTISGWRPLGESSALYRRLSSLRKAPPAVYLGRPPQTGQSAVQGLSVDLGFSPRLRRNMTHAQTKVRATTLRSPMDLGQSLSHTQLSLSSR